MADGKIMLNKASYKDKVYSCWIGKNIGGTIGTPYEGRRELLDVKGFTTAPNVVLPNDDLDLQLVWLHAVERVGAKAINTAVLGEFWLSYIVPYWNEYGLGKANLERGLMSPLSGDYNNDWQHSNGAWIRTEVWACLAPGCPDIAARYAMEDAKVDHGSGEGTFAAAFVAALQSAAFIINDLRACIEVGLSKIPAECRMAKSIRTVLQCYDEGKKWDETRNIILAQNMDIGDGWFEAPSNVSYAIIGLLWGEGDFKKSMLTAVNCGDDTDCTAATVGATLGILGGSALIPDDWKDYIGDDIVTISINRGCVARNVPSTCTELSERVIKQAPAVIFTNNGNLEFTDGETVIPDNVFETYCDNRWYNDTLDRVKPYSFSIDSVFMSAIITYDGAPDISPMGEKKVHLTFKNNYACFDIKPYNLELRWWLPEGFVIEGGRKSITLPHFNVHQKAKCEMDVVIKAGENVEAINKCVLEVTAVGRSIPLYIPIVLLG